MIDSARPPHSGGSAFFYGRESIRVKMPR